MRAIVRVGPAKSLPPERVGDCNGHNVMWDFTPVRDQVLRFLETDGRELSSESTGMGDVKVKLGPADLQEGELRGYAVGKRNVLIARVGGRVKGLDDWCNHGGCLLSGGRLERNTVVCPCHEVGFDLDTGKNVTSPGVADDQRVVPVEIQGGELVAAVETELHTRGDDDGGGEGEVP